MVVAPAFAKGQQTEDPEIAALVFDIEGLSAEGVADGVTDQETWLTSTILAKPPQSKPSQPAIAQGIARSSATQSRNVRSI